MQNKVSELLVCAVLRGDFLDGHSTSMYDHKGGRSNTDIGGRNRRWLSLRMRVPEIFIPEKFSTLLRDNRCRYGTLTQEGTAYDYSSLHDATAAYSK